MLAEAGGADVVVKASGVGVFDDELLEGVLARGAARTRCAIFWDVDAPATLAEMRRRSPTHPLRARCPKLDLVLTYGGGPPVVDGLRGARRARTACRSTTRSIPTTHHPGRRRIRASPATSPSSPTACRTARRGSRSSSSSPPRALPERRFLLGGNGWDDKAMPANVRHARPCLHGRRTTRSTSHAARRAERRPRQHGRSRLLAGDARVRGGRRRRLPDHRRLGGHRAVPRARTRRCWSRATARTWPSTCAALTPGARPRDRRRRRARRVLAEHTYARRGARGGRAAARGAGAASAQARALA